ncbi:insulinase family protein [Alteromonas sp. ASW11-19]|uniref:Insulinase family protein n=1 Tax=Alteromonas salexigens TaxID=2982530 RepID=A0ABT2VVG8_9ALTE|nr:pitrilysin family protein [Alteromonas salexigens]MCU7555839.1 insulinase family protein [Alteromonas salexigens]
MKRIFSQLITPIMFAVMSASVTASDFPSTPPAPGEPKDFALPSVSSYTLPNGLQVTFIPYGETPKSTMVLQFDTGNQHDDTQGGLADIVFELLKQGTDTLDASAIATQAASMGGQVSTRVGMNSSHIALDVLSEFNREAVSLLATLVASSMFEETDLQRAIQNQWRDIEVARSRAQGQAVVAFYEKMYGEHPYSHIYPTKAELHSITRDDVREFAETYLTASNAHLYIAGRFNQTQMQNAIRNAFEDLPAGGPIAPVAPPAQQAAPGLTLIPREGAVQATVRIGQRTVPMSHKDYVPLEVMNTLLGGMFSSRITQNIREDKGYTYSPRSALYSYKDASVWYQAADIQAESTGDAINEIVKEISGLQEIPPPAEELQGVKNYMSGLFVLRNSSRAGVIAQLVRLNVNDLPQARLTDYISMVNQVSAEQVSRVAVEYLNLDDMSVIVVGDKQQMNEQLSVVEKLPVTQLEK